MFQASRTHARKRIKGVGKTNILSTLTHLCLRGPLRGTAPRLRLVMRARAPRAAPRAGRLFPALRTMCVFYNLGVRDGTFAFFLRQITAN